MRIDVGRQIRIRRHKRGWSVNLLAERMFGDANRGGYISLVENGKKSISLERLCDFAYALGCCPTEILQSAMANAEHASAPRHDERPQP